MKCIDKLLSTYHAASTAINKPLLIMRPLYNRYERPKDKAPGAQRRDSTICGASCQGTSTAEQIMSARLHCAVALGADVSAGQYGEKRVPRNAVFGSRSRLCNGLIMGASLIGTAFATPIQDMPGGPAVMQLNFAAPVTKIAEDIHWLHWMMLILCLIIFIAVFGVMFYSIIKHRKSRGHQAANFHESTTVEIIWTIIPFLIVIGMALPATKTVVAMKDTSNAELTIKVTGYQWKWAYDYLQGEGEGIHFFSNLSTPREQIDGKAPLSNTYLMEVDHELVVPVNKKIRIVTTANDVIHSWAVPAFGVKQDAIPGFVRDTWFRAEKTGVYRGQCSELCGKDHAFMPIVVRVLSTADYTEWVQAKQKEMLALADDPTKIYTLAELKERGAKVYASNCAVCHQPSGKGGGIYPALDGSKVVLGSEPEQIKLLLQGRKAMPSWKSLSDVELAAVMTFTRNNWSNQTGELIQPAMFTAARANK